MWPKISNANWFQYVVTIVVAILTVVFAQSWQDKREGSISIKNELKTKASIDYVDKQDANVVNTIKQHMEESKTTDDKEMQLIQSMDRKIDILINKIDQ